MQAQMAIFLVAGYETTSTALGFTAHDLAVNPLVQKKLQEEIDSAFPSKVSQSNRTMIKCKFSFHNKIHYDFKLLK